MMAFLTAWAPVIGLVLGIYLTRRHGIGATLWLAAFLLLLSQILIYFGG